MPSAANIMGSNDPHQHFCLRWNNYRTNITSAFENLRDDQDFVDVTLACDGKSLKAHRVVLSACSSYFRELLKSTPCKHPVVVLQDVSFEDLQKLVEFIYHGEVNVQQKNLTSFLKTAQVLKVSGLTQQQQASSTSSSCCSTSSPSSSSITTTDGAFQEQQHQQQQQSSSSPVIYPQIMAAQQSTNIEEMNSPRQHKSRRSIRSPTPIRCLYPTRNSESPVPSKRPKSVEMSFPLTPYPFPNLSPSLLEECHSNSGRYSPRRDENDNDEETSSVSAKRYYEEPPVDYSQKKTSSALSSPHASPSNNNNDNSNNITNNGRNENAIKDEPIDLVSNNDDHSNEESNMSEDDGLSEEERSPSNRQQLMIGQHPEDSFPNHHNIFSFAAAAAAASLVEFNHQNPVSAASAMLDRISGSSQELLMPPPMIGNMNEPQNCPYCRRTFSCYYSLKRHFQDKHDHRNTLYVCEFCNRRYRTKNSLTTHKSLQHRATSGLLKRLIKSNVSSSLMLPPNNSLGGDSSSFSQHLPFVPEVQSTSLLFRSIMYNNNRQRLHF